MFRLINMRYIHAGYNDKKYRHVGNDKKYKFRLIM